MPAKIREKDGKESFPQSAKFFLWFGIFDVMLPYNPNNMKLIPVQRTKLNKSCSYLARVNSQCNENGWVVCELQENNSLIEPISIPDIDDYVMTIFELP